MRWRCSFGRMSPTVCVAAFVWPLAWQSKQATPELRLEAAAVVGRVELLLRERRHQQPQSFELLGIEDVLEQLVEVVERHELALRDVAQIGPRREVDRRRELGQQVLRQIEVEIEARQVAVGLLLRLVDQRLGEDHAARFVMRVRQRVEAGRPEIALLDLVRRHAASLSQVIPCGSSTRTPPCTGLPRDMVDALRRLVGEVVALGEQVLLALRERGLLLLEAPDERLEVFIRIRRVKRERRCENEQWDGGASDSSGREAGASRGFRHEGWRSRHAPLLANDAW